MRKVITNAKTSGCRRHFSRILVTKLKSFSNAKLGLLIKGSLFPCCSLDEAARKPQPSWDLQENKQECEDEERCASNETTSEDDKQLVAVVFSTRNRKRPQQVVATAASLGFYHIQKSSECLSKPSEEKLTKPSSKVKAFLGRFSVRAQVWVSEKERERMAPSRRQIDWSFNLLPYRCFT